MSDSDCRSANWRQRGEQDGVAGLQPRIDVYSSQCTRYGVQPPASDYMQGWESGNFLEGQGDFPVTGVSWFEAAAYSAFMGRSLPTIFHWSVQSWRRHA